MAKTTTHVVGNRELILGIDELYRDAMKRFETEQLLPAARAVASVLEAQPASVPIEGYYTETPELTEYFQWMRSLQKCARTQRPLVESHSEFQLLERVSQSPIYGLPENSGALFPAARDSLYFALVGLPSESWTITNLVDRAYEEAIDRDDFSLVGLASRTRDEVVIAALRESVVLYAAIGLGAPRQVSYEWVVDADLERAANQFIDECNALVPGAIRQASPDNAEYFYNAFKRNDILGRCVRIGFDNSSTPIRHYHWAIQWNKGRYGEYGVREFWSDEIWTTERNRNQRRFS